MSGAATIAPLRSFLRMFVIGGVIGTGAVALPRAPAGVSGTGASARVHEVRMVEADGHYRFVPATLTVPRGDTVVFTVVSGAPHNVAFDTTALAAAAKRALRPLVRDPIAPFAGALLTKQGDRVVLPTASLPPGEYPFFCLPHAALAMKGVLTVR